MYNPATGRFLQTDPVEGGTLNDYVYVSDPINQFDLNGMFGLPDFVSDAWDATAGKAITAINDHVVKPVVHAAKRAGHALAQAGRHAGRFVKKHRAAILKGVLIGAAGLLAAACVAATAGVCGSAVGTFMVTGGLGAGEQVASTALSPGSHSVGEYGRNATVGFITGTTASLFFPNGLGSLGRVGSHSGGFTMWDIVSGRYFFP